MKSNKQKINNENNKGKNKSIKKVIIILLWIIIAFFALLKINDFIILDKNKKINLVINNKNVTSNLKYNILIENNEPYLSKQDLKNFFDKYIYEDDNYNKIITTYDTKVAAISLDEKEMKVNGSSKKMSLSIIKKDNTIYIPLEELKDIYGIEFDYIEKTKVLVIDSITREQKKAIVSNTTSVKSSTKFISKTIDRIKKGDYIIVISENKGYTKIRTKNGKIGYIKSKKVANIVTVRENIEEEKQIEGKVNLAWDYYSIYASAPDRSDESMEGVNVVSPAFFYLNDDGILKENIGNDGINYINWAHDNGYKVWPMVQNSEAKDINVTSGIMNDYKKREKLIEDIVNYCIKYKLDGINMDFENMKQEDKDMYSRFIIELVPRLKEIGMVVSVDVTAPDGSETWSLCFDRTVLGDVADYIVFMAYDEYGNSSNKAGTTAGYDWVELGLNKFLGQENVDSDKIILAIPLYTRIWVEDGNGKVISKNAVSIKNLSIPDNVQKNWDDKLKQYYVEYKDGSYTKKIWVEDEKSLEEKISLITKNKLAGVASWEIGMEKDGFWEFLNNKLNNQ